MGQRTRYALLKLRFDRILVSGIDHNKAFSGNRSDNDDYAYVGSGEDDDPFILGITSLAMIDGSLLFGSASTFTLFHADATFKLSDIGYPFRVDLQTRHARISLLRSLSLAIEVRLSMENDLGA